MQAEELTLKIKADASQAERAVGGFADKAVTDAKRVGGAMKNAGKKMTMGMTLPIVAGAGLAIKAFTAQEDATRKLQSTFDSTGASAWTSMEALQANADALQQITTHGDEAIEEMQSVLLTFTQIKGQNFDTATKSILNMSDALGMDLQSASVMVGKALNDPVAGISAMSRAGITFSEEQKEMIKTMVEAGDTAGAQAVMLGELETQFGGTAEAMAETSSGQMKQAMNTLGDSMETVGGIIIPILTTVTDAIGWLATKFDGLSPGMKKTILLVIGVVAAIGPLLWIGGLLVTLWGVLTTVATGLGVAIAFLTSPIGLVLLAIAALIAIGVLIWKNWDTIKEMLLKVWALIQEKFDAFLLGIKTIWNATWGAIKDFFTGIWDGITGFITTTIDTIKEKINSFILGVKTIWNTTWGAIKDTFTAIWDGITGAVTTAVGAIETAIGNVIDTVTGAWETFTGFLSDAWNAVWDGLGAGVTMAMDGAIALVKGYANTLLFGLESLINGVINILNTAIGAYNSIPLAPDIPKIPNVSVPRLAEGGLVNRMGPVKVGERGVEIVNLPAGASVQPDVGQAGPSINIERMESGDPLEMAQEIGWEFTKRGSA